MYRVRKRDARRRFAYLLAIATALAVPLGTHGAGGKEAAVVGDGSKSAGRASTASNEAFLQGVSSVDIAVERMSAGDQACGLSRDAVYRAVRGRLIAGGVRVTSGRADATVYVRTTTLYLKPRPLCATDWLLEVHVFGDFRTKHGISRFTRLSGFSAGKLNASEGTRGHGAYMNSIIAAAAERAAAEIVRANKTPR